MASNKFPKAGTHVLMKSYGVMISSRTSMILVYTRSSMGARSRTLCFMSLASCLFLDNDVKLLGDIKAWLFTQFSMKNRYTRPDITYAWSVTSRYQACAGEAHWNTVKIILKYLKRTQNMFLIYGGGELILEDYSDGSFQLDNDDAKSQSSFVFKLNGGVVDWKSSKQASTADSPSEAEYIAASDTAKKAVWMKNYIQELVSYLVLQSP
ncbi:UNVERIFIED_CONTAM: Copia protein [Sesamum calycinum]|uniref:Copia protein n=1 Tax=Sesamum calycinum TaxID=2727403 RepID=A0AAW2SVE4_9LAMI